ncbi:arginine N-succinyltransferase [Marinomonas agarivorans]|nr:arginine N-succinyltransferase [Marinomonas agarivorans]
MMVIRPIQKNELETLYTLAEKTGVGFTSLTPDRAILQNKIDQSVASFKKEVNQPRDESYLFVLEDTTTGQIVGTSGLLGTVGLDEPFYSYHLGNIVHSSRELGVHNIMPTLILNNDYTGFSELCSLFLEENYRHSKNGQLLSKARFLFLAQFPQRFTDKIFAEMRGVCDEKGRSPLWESLGRHFFSLDFAKADELTSLGSKQFIAELMPNNPVYTALLSQEARDVLGQVHHNTAPARRLLEQEGFRYENYVDIFDGGPTIEARVADIRSVRESKLFTVTISDQESAEEQAQNEAKNDFYLVANTQLTHFRCVLVQRKKRPKKTLRLTEAEAANLNVTQAESVRVVALSPKTRR